MFLASLYTQILYDLGSGIYHNLKQYNLPYPEAIFDIAYFRNQPKPFNTWAKEFFPGVKYRPNVVHYFVKLLDDKGKLTRIYTQVRIYCESLVAKPLKSGPHTEYRWPGESNRTASRQNSSCPRILHVRVLHLVWTPTRIGKGEADGLERRSSYLRQMQRCG